MRNENSSALVWDAETFRSARPQKQAGRQPSISGIIEREAHAHDPPRRELALAYLQRDRTADVPKHLQTTVAWMRQGTAPVRAAALAGLATAGPLSALGGLVVRSPVPRLESLHPQTAYELNTLRAEVEKAMAAVSR